MQDVVDIQAELINEAGRQMAREIDFGVLCGFLQELGWTKVVLQPMTKEHGDAIDHWTRTQLIGNFETMGLVWIFENPGDAVNFTLKWS